MIVGGTSWFAQTSYEIALLVTMRPYTFLLILISCFLSLGIRACLERKTSEPRVRLLSDRVFEKTETRLERGRYLSEGILQCFVCHSERDWTLPGAPPIPTMLGAGQAIYDDSTIFLPAPNITPEPETGAGTWTDDMLARAIREGIGHDGRALHPQMWYSSFRLLSDEDIASVIVFLRSLPPVRHKLPPRRLSESRLREIAEGPLPLDSPVPAPDLSDAVKRGKYLADLADCIGCHTAWEAPYAPGIFGGGNLIERTGKRYHEHAFSSNLTPDPSGIPYYDDSLFIEVMRTGRVGAREVNPVMPWMAFRNMNSTDLGAIFAYLRTLPPVRHIIDNAQEPSLCSMCGQEHGEGWANVSKLDLIRPLAVSTVTLQSYIGVYEHSMFTIELILERDTLRGRSSGMDMVFVMDADSFFHAREWPGRVSFTRYPTGRVINLVSHEDEDFIALKR